jgi:hypothetical protein
VWVGAGTLLDQVDCHHLERDCCYQGPAWPRATYVQKFEKCAWPSRIRVSLLGLVGDIVSSTMHTLSYNTASGNVMACTFREQNRHLCRSVPTFVQPYSVHSIWHQPHDWFALHHLQQICDPCLVCPCTSKCDAAGTLLQLCSRTTSTCGLVSMHLTCLHSVSAVLLPSLWKLRMEACPNDSSYYCTPW